MPPVPPEWGLQGIVPTLPIEIGMPAAATDLVALYQPGQWVPFFRGPQNFIHVHGDIRVRVAGATGEKIKVQTQRIGVFGCDGPTFVGIESTAATTQLFRESEEMFTSVKKPQLLVLGPASKAQEFCGKSMSFWVFARLAGTTTWGAAHRLVRLYDGGTTMILP